MGKSQTIMCMMKDLWENGLLPRILLLGVIIALLGIAPISKTVTRGFERVRRAQSAAHPAAVAENLASIAKQQPWRDGYWEPAGHAAVAAADLQSASNYFAQAAAKGELSAEGYLAWGDADWLLLNPQTALQIWPIAEKLGVSADEILPRQAEVYRALGDDLALVETLRAFIQIPAMVSGSPSEVATIYHELGLLLAAHYPESAPAYLSQAIEFDPALETQIRSLNFAIQRALSKDDPIYLLLESGRALANLGRWDLAEKAFENAVDYHPEYAEAWAYLGEARQHTDTNEDPHIALQTAYDLNPESVGVNTFIALYWQRQAEPEIALEYLQSAMKLDPRNPALLVEAGNLAAILGDLEAGQEYYWQAIDLSPNDPKYMREFLKFSLRFNLNLREIALPVARQLVMLNPNDPAALDVMGDVLLYLEDDLNAERFYLRALEHNPNYDQAHFHLGGLYRLQGKSDLAQFHYNEVIELTNNPLIMGRAQQALDEYFSP